MKIQVNFTDPSIISPRIVRITPLIIVQTEEDKIKIVFMDGELLKNTNGLRYITDNYTLETGLPRQIVQTSKIIIIYT